MSEYHHKKWISTRLAEESELLRLRAAVRELDDLTKRIGPMADRYNDLINDFCECGGGGPNDDHSCGACRSYHIALDTIRAILARHGVKGDGND